MLGWKRLAFTAGLVMVFSLAVQADDSASDGKDQRHMVDMADGLNAQQFMESKNPDAFWTSTMYVPWKRTGAIKAYQESGKDAPAELNSKGGINAYKDVEKSASAVSADKAIQEENLAMPAASSVKSVSAKSDAASAKYSAEVAGMVDGKKIESDQLVNIRVMYGLDPANTKAAFTPASSQNELFRQMSKFCSYGFQKVGEWSELVEGSDYYLYYQFQCIEKHQMN